MTDVGTETIFRLDHRKHFQKKETSLKVRGQLMRSNVLLTTIDLHLRRSACTSEKIDLRA